MPPHTTYLLLRLSFVVIVEYYVTKVRRNVAKYIYCRLSVYSYH